MNQAINKLIFDKWKSHCAGDQHNKDENGNESYLANGIKVTYVKEPSEYQWNKQSKATHLIAKDIYQEGYYVLSTRTNNYDLIKVVSHLEFILGFDLDKRVAVKDGRITIYKPISLHNSMKKHLGIYRLYTNHAV